MPGIFVAQLPQRCDLQESFDGRWAEPLYNILIREVRRLVPPESRQRSIERRHFLHLHTPTMEYYTYNNGLMQAAGAGIWQRLSCVLMVSTCTTERRRAHLTTSATHSKGCMEQGIEGDSPPFGAFAL